MTYLAYLDEFGHIGPYVGRGNRRYNSSPVFGFAGYVLPANQVRGFGTWFFQRKCELLDFEIQRSGQHAALWEKKGASLYTVTNVRKYRQLRHFTNRLFNKIERLGGFVLYVGGEKTEAPGSHDSKELYVRILLEAVKRIDQFCFDDHSPPDNFLLALDEHEQRSDLLTLVSQAMYGGATPRCRLIEPPFHLESHRYQTVQAADWICGLVGRLGAFWADPEGYPENELFLRYFGHRLNQVSRRSGIRIAVDQPDSSSAVQRPANGRT